MAKNMIVDFLKTHIGLSWPHCLANLTIQNLLLVYRWSWLWFWSHGQTSLAHLGGKYQQENDQYSMQPNQTFRASYQSKSHGLASTLDFVKNTLSTILNWFFVKVNHNGSRCGSLCGLQNCVIVITSPDLHRKKDHLPQCFKLNQTFKDHSYSCSEQL